MTAGQRRSRSGAPSRRSCSRSSASPRRARAREVRDVSAVVATRSLVQVALVPLNSWAAVRAGAPPTARRAFALSALSLRTNIGFYFGAEYHDGTKRRST